LSAAPNVPNLPECVLFEHNVESTIWQRRVEHAANPAARWYLGIQASRMLRYEGEVCRTARRVIAVSELDAERMRKQFQTPGEVAVPTGVDVEYFTPPSPQPISSDLVFVGSMDWMPNSEGILWFVREVLPVIRGSRPGCSLTVVGRKPSEDILQLAKNDPHITVTGTVPDVRPYLWQSNVSIVPLRIGGGTRLKIYEAMAARSPVVSTTIGAEGLAVSGGEDIRLADTPESFARICIELLESQPARERLAQAAWDLVQSRCSWEAVSREFERLLIS
ncbi:MAG: glycosyltransferase, partial [Bryobacteraceae bacterium]